jgi:hypothetical protein
MPRRRFRDANKPGEVIDVVQAVRSRFIIRLRNRVARLGYLIGLQTVCDAHLIEVSLASWSRASASKSPAFINLLWHSLPLTRNSLSMSALMSAKKSTRFTTWFIADIGAVRFTRDANQHISGFVLNAGRIRNFRFARKTD